MFQLVTLRGDTRSYPISVLSIADGVTAIEMTFDLLRGSDVSFEARVIDGHGNDNGWALLKTGNGYVFMFSCATPVNGFQVGHGANYAYKIGQDREMLDWPTVEFTKIPRHCFLTDEQVTPLIVELMNSCEPELSGGFVFSADEWEHIC